MNLYRYVFGNIYIEIHQHIAISKKVVRDF